MKLSDIRSRLSGINKSSENREKLRVKLRRSTKQTPKKNEHNPDNVFLSGAYKSIIIRIIAAIAILVLSNYVEMNEIVKLVLKIAAAGLAGYDLVLKAISDITSIDLSSGSLPILLSAIMLFVVGLGTYAVLVILIAQAGIVLRDYALAVTIKASGGYNSANNNVAENDMLFISDGQVFPCDCVISDGLATAIFDRTSGNSKIVKLKMYDFVPAGTKCVSGQISAIAVNVGENTLPAKINNTITCGSKELTHFSRIVFKVSKLFVPICIALSVVVLILLTTIGELSWAAAATRAAAILAVSSSIGMILLTSNYYFIGMSSAKNSGIVFKNAEALENATNIGGVIFDKVGTLTSNNYTVTEINTDKMDPQTESLKTLR